MFKTYLGLEFPAENGLTNEPNLIDGVLYETPLETNVGWANEPSANLGLNVGSSVLLGSVTVSVGAES